MSPFDSALRKVVAAVHQAFKSDDQMDHWLSALNTLDSAHKHETEATLKRLLNNLGTGWVSTMLVNEDPNEEGGVLAEAVIAEAREYAERPLTRSAFAYRLADRIVNKGIRPLNRSARRLEPHPAVDAFLQLSTAAEFPVSEADWARYDKAVAALLERETRSNEVATARITMDVARAWEDALRLVDAELGGARAKPMSAAVKQMLADRLGLPVSTVEAAMKRYKRAIQRVRANELR